MHGGFRRVKVTREHRLADMIAFAQRLELLRVKIRAAVR